MENGWDDGFSIHFKVKASFLGQSQEFFKHEPGRSLKNRVNARVDQSCVALSVLLCDKDLVLHVEVRNVVF
jgi:hypothetical protein